MLRARLEKRVGRVKDHGKFTLDGYRLRFNCGNQQTSFANIQPEIGSQVQGVLYSLTLDQLFILDHYEGNGHPNGYNRIVELVNDQIVFVYVNWEVRQDCLNGVSAEYMLTLLDGYKQHDIDWDRDYLGGIPLTNARKYN